MEKSTAEVIVKVYAVLAWISALIAVIAAFAITTFGSMVGVFGTMDTADFATAGIVGGIATAVAVILILIAAFDIIVGIGLWQKKNWARIAAIVCSVISLFSFPFGTIMGGLGIYFFGFDPAVKSVFGVKSGKDSSAKTSKSSKKSTKKSSKKKKR